MAGGKKKKKGATCQSQTDRETRNNGNASETRSENGDDTEDETSPATLLRKVVSEVVAAGMRDLKTEMKKELSQVRTSFKECKTATGRADYRN